MIQQRNAWSTLARLLTGWFCTFSMCALTAAQEATHPLRAGAALANITPPLGEPIVGGFNPLPSDDVHDELHVRALVLTESKSDSAVDRGNEPPAFQPGRTVVIALCDNVGISREVFDQAKKLIEKETGIPGAQVLLAATHTHSATSARSSNAMIIGGPLSDYQAFLSRRIGDAVRLAIKRLAPAKIAWGSVDEPSQLFNRRWFVVEEKERHNPFGGVDQVRMNPGGAATLIRPAGTTDPQISFISVQHADGRPLAILGNYSLHYVGGVPARTISADYFAVFANHLTELLGAQQQDPPFVGMLSNGTSGDVNNINFRERGKSLPNFEKMRQVGQLVAQRVHSAVAQLPHHGWVTLSGQASELELGVRKPTAEMLRVAQEVLAKPESAERHHAQERVYAQRIQLQAEAGPTVMVPLQVLRIAAAADTAAPLQKLGIAAIPFEVFTETGLEIKERSPIKPTFTIELAGGSFGYLPTPPQHALGGYETWLGTNKVEIEASTKIVARLLQLFEQTEAAAHSQASQGK